MMRAVCMRQRYIKWVRKAVGCVDREFPSSSKLIGQWFTLTLDFLGSESLSYNWFLGMKRVAKAHILSHSASFFPHEKLLKHFLSWQKEIMQLWEKTEMKGIFWLCNMHFKWYNLHILLALTFPSDIYSIIAHIKIPRKTTPDKEWFHPS